MKPMRILIVGGVAGGASTAARVRRLSEEAQIIVLERGPHVSFANCGLPYFVGGEIEEREHLLLRTPESLRASLNLDVRVMTEVLSIDREARQVSVRRNSRCLPKRKGRRRGNWGWNISTFRSRPRRCVPSRWTSSARRPVGCRPQCSCTATRECGRGP